jgi:rubrerythrin
MDILPLLERCIAIERTAGEIYATLARRTVGDSELRQFWTAMADDERRHAAKLEAWRQLSAAGRPEERAVAEGFEEGVAEIEELVARAREEVEHVASADDGFAIALELEMSELDAIYTTLLQSSPFSRYPDVAETQQREVADHHEALVRAVRARSRDEQNLTRAALIAAKD